MFFGHLHSVMLTCLIVLTQKKYDVTILLRILSVLKQIKTAKQKQGGWINGVRVRAEPRGPLVRA